MFQFPRFPRSDLCIQSVVPRHYPGWVSPFGDLRVITLARSSPRHFVACHVLHRLLAPRHPPRALCSLTSLQQLTQWAGAERRLGFITLSLITAEIEDQFLITSSLVKVPPPK